MTCIICEVTDSHCMECDFCDNFVCDDCAITGDLEELFCSEECKDENLRG